VKQLKTILGMLILVVGGVLLFYTVPTYYANFKLDGMLSNQAIYYTNFPKPDEVVKADVAQRAQEYGIPLTPEQVIVTHGGATLTLAVQYTVHIDLPLYPFDLNFDNSTTNKDIMK